MNEGAFVFPMSFAQERLWFLAQLEPDSAAYCLAAPVVITGALDLDLVERCIREIVRRHESLRTTFDVIDGQPVQVIWPSQATSVPRVDLGALPAELCEPEIRRLVERETRRPFDLVRGPLLRLLVIRRGPAEHVLLWVVHHGVFDGWSTRLVLGEFAALYAAWSQGRGSPLPELALQYADFASWQRERAGGGVFAKELAYWTQRLAGQPAVLSLPTDRPRPAFQRHRGARQYFQLPRRLADDLDALARQHDTTLYTVLVAAFQVVLARYTATLDISVGTPVTNRNRTGLESIVGCFANTVVLRTDLAGDPTFLDLLGRVKQTVRDAQAHQEVPFDLVVDAVRPVRDPSHAPLCQVLFALEATGPMPAFPGLSLQLLDVDTGAAQLDLALEMARHPDGLTGAVEYDADLFDPSTIERFTGHFAQLLAGAVAEPSARLSELSMLAPAERSDLVAWSAAGQGTVPVVVAVHRRFELEAARAPSATAVVDDGHSITYGELDRRAERLAGILRRRGVGPETRVGVLVPRSIGMIVAVMGTLKAGGTYVPLDPRYPGERIATMIAQAGVGLVVVADGAANELPAEIETIVLEADPPLVDGDSPRSPAPSPEQAAYILYTSGSTGVPRGVAVSHGALAHFVESAATLYELTPADRVLQFASLCFDASAEEIFCCLTRGATLVLRTEPMLESVRAFLGACAAWGVTVLDLPTAYFHHVAADVAAGLAIPASLRLVIIGGEAALPERVSAWRASVGDRVRLVNTYGPTEATIVTTACDLAAVDPRDAAVVPIGRPLAHASAHVLDAAGQPAPIGVTGELYLGGDGLARGYWGCPAITAERFVPDPFSQRGGERLYRTGDRARWRRNGQLEFIGRVDDQVKIRGFRIEPGEVEARLSSVPGVREAVVVVEEARPGVRRLIAYAGAASGIQPEQLRQALRTQLPDYLVPSSFVVLAELPRTPQGKIDRRALPAPTADSDDAVGPRTRVETTLAQIWAELLGHPVVSVYDNFFELGGDSILALAVVARARAAGVVLEARHILQHQTVAELAAVARASEGAPASADMLEGEVPLTPIQRWLFEQGGPNPHHFNQAVLLSLREPLDRSALEAAVTSVVDRHDVFRLRFMQQDGVWRQRYAAAPGAAVTAVDLAGVAPDEQASAVTQAAQSWQGRLDLSDGPLLRAVLFDLGPAPGRLLLVVHHLVVDAVSWRILLEDLELAYRQHLDGERLQLPERTTSFGRWAHQLQAFAMSDEVARHRSAWIAAASAAAVVPVDDPAGSALEADTLRCTDWLGADDTRALLDATSAYRTRVAELLLAALGEALAAWIGDPDVVVDVEGHGRDALPDADVSRTIGWFTSVFPVRLSLLDAAPDRAIKTVKEELRQAARIGASFGLLRHVRDHEPGERLPSRARVSFNYLGQWDELFASSALFAAADDVGADRDGQAPRAYELEVDAAIVGGRLRTTWSYSGARHRRQTIAALRDAFAARLDAIVRHCLEPTAGGCTPSDIPLARLDQAGIDRLLGSARDVADMYPLSPTQQGLLFHSLWEPASGVYVEQVTCRLVGALDVEAFRGAWQAVVRHHTALRTTFVWEGADEPLQVVRSDAPIAIELEDRRGEPPEQQQARIAGDLAADRARGFDLGQGPLTRLSLVRVEDDVRLVIWTHHHLILDGWSAALVLRDVFSAYDALRAGGSVALSPRRPYRDHIAWLAQHDPAAAESFWRHTLGGFTSSTPLPLVRSAPEARDAPEAPADSERRGARRRALSPSLTVRLERFARAQRVTLSTVFQAAWALVLGRTARSEDVVFGITVAGRSAPLPGIDAMVGLLINTLPLRVAVPTAAVVADWLRAVQTATTELGPHEYTSLARTRAWSAVPAGQPLFESVLVFENYPADPRVYEGMPGLAVRDVAFTDQTNYPLAWTVTPGRELELRLSFERRLLDDAAASRLVDMMERALVELASRPEARLGELALLPESEARRVLVEWNATERAVPGDLLVHEQIDAQAARRPEDIAVIFGDVHLSYRELAARANQVAHALRRRGVGPDSLVAIAAERSVELVVGLVGIMKAGAAYVPIDPEYPSDRVAYMLEDARAPVLLSQWPVASRLPPHGAELLCLDTDRAEIEREPSTPPAVQLSPDHLAYTIYTSGSTGQPKGAGNTHGGLRNRLAWMQDCYGLTPLDRVLQKTPFSFDVSVWEFFWPLITGATLVVARPGDHRDGDRLVELITRHAVTTLHFVPPMLQGFLATPGASQCRSLRRVIASGEALPAELARRFFEALDAELHNLYGPTEASIDVTAWACRAGDASTSVPIGHPIANTQIYILDRAGHPVPPGVPGELHIGGVGLARGYHRRPALTAERFVPDPFSAAPGARLYRTADLARHRPDGAIEFLGRLDHQVKIRGHRIELGEIEARLLQHPGVAQAVVVVREQAHGGKRLVAYVAARGDAPSPDALRAWAAEFLPAHMVPSAIAVLDRLPLGTSGKVDRRALPALETGAAERAYVAPSTDAERALAEVWAEVLHVERVGRDDDFFALGGDSIVALQVIARAARCGLRLSPRQLFEHPTVAAAAAVAQAAASQPPAPEPPPAASPDLGLSADDWDALLEELDR